MGAAGLRAAVSLPERSISRSQCQPPGCMVHPGNENKRLWTTARPTPMLYNLATYHIGIRMQQHIHDSICLLIFPEWHNFVNLHQQALPRW